MRLCTPLWASQPLWASLSPLCLRERVSVPGTVYAAIHVPVPSLQWLLWQFHQALSISPRVGPLTIRKGQEIQKQALPGTELCPVPGATLQVTQWHLRLQRLTLPLHNPGSVSGYPRGA